MFFSPRTRPLPYLQARRLPYRPRPLLNALASLARLAPKRGAPVIVSSLANFNIASIAGALRLCHPECCRLPRTCQPSHATDAHHGPSGLCPASTRRWRRFNTSIRRQTRSTARSGLVVRRGRHGTGSGVSNICRRQLVAVRPHGEFVQGLGDGMRGKRGLGRRARIATAGLIERAGCFAAGFDGAPGIHLPPMPTAPPPIGDRLAERKRRGPQPVKKHGKALRFMVTPGREGRRAGISATSLCDASCPEWTSAFPARSARSRHSWDVAPRHPQYRGW